MRATVAVSVRRQACIVLALAVATLMPGTASAAAPVPPNKTPGAVTMPLTVVGGPASASATAPGSGPSPDGYVFGNCGWANIFGYDLRNGNAQVSASAYSSLGPIISSIWTETWWNESRGYTGNRSNGGAQIPNNYWNPGDWFVHTGAGTVLFGLPTLTVTIVGPGGLILHCVGGDPTDLETITG